MRILTPLGGSLFFSKSKKRVSSLDGRELLVRVLCYIVLPFRNIAFISINLFGKGSPVKCRALAGLAV